MQDAARIQEQIDYQTEHQKAKAAVAQEQLVNVTRNKLMAEQELAKFRVLREGFNVASGVMKQQLTQIRAQTPPNPVSINAFEGALGHLEGLMKQADMAIAKNEGSFMAFTTMEQQFQQQAMEAVGRERALLAQGGNAVELASRVSAETIEAVETGETMVSVDPPAAPKSLEDLLDAADAEPTQEPIAAPKKTTPSKGRGRKQKRR